MDRFERRDSGPPRRDEMSFGGRFEKRPEGFHERRGGSRGREIMIKSNRDHDRHLVQSSHRNHSPRRESPRRGPPRGDWKLERRDSRYKLHFNSQRKSLKYLCSYIGIEKKWDMYMKVAYCC